jgi:hypothetical protein
VLNRCATQEQGLMARLKPRPFKSRARLFVVNGVGEISLRHRDETKEEISPPEVSQPPYAKAYN